MAESVHVIVPGPEESDAAPDHEPVRLSTEGCGWGVGVVGVDDEPPHPAITAHSVTSNNEAGLPRI